MLTPCEKGELWPNGGDSSQKTKQNLMISGPRVGMVSVEMLSITFFFMINLIGETERPKAGTQ